MERNPFELEISPVPYTCVKSPKNYSLHNFFKTLFNIIEYMSDNTEEESEKYKFEDRELAVQLARFLGESAAFLYLLNMVDVDIVRDAVLIAIVPPALALGIILIYERIVKN